MKTDRLLVAACASLALAFIFSCSSEGDGSSSDDGGSSSSNDSNCPIDGYRTVEINGQIWMAENLNCNVSGSKCYGEDGRVIMGYDQEADEDIFTTLSPAEVQANCEKYGRLYDWFTANKVCPSGWHLPSNEDWDKLYSFVEDGECEYYDESNNYDGIEGYCPTAGKHLKSDRHGFLALPGGVSYGSSGGFLFNGVGDVGYWWGSSEYNKRGYASYMGFDFYFDDDDAVGWGNSAKAMMYSVRCVKD